MNRRDFVVAAAALAVAPEALARRLGRGAVALVTADLESRIVAVDLSSGKILRRIPTFPDPRSIELVGGSAVVAHTAGASVSIVDAARLEVRKVLHDFDEPRYTAASRGGRYAFVTDSGSESIVVVDVVRGRVVRRLAVGGPARHVSVDQAGRRLWTALGTKAPRIAVLDVRDPRRPQLLGRIKAPFLAHDVGFAPSGRLAWVTSGDREEVALFDPRKALALRRLAGGAPPQHVAFNGRLAFVTSGDDGTLHTHDLHTGRLLRAERIPVGSFNVAQGQGWVSMPSLSQGTLCVADDVGRVRRSLRVARSSHDACLA